MSAYSRGFVDERDYVFGETVTYEGDFDHAVLGCVLCGRAVVELRGGTTLAHVMREVAAHAAVNH